jgi:acyl-CoA synthetase (AMP-forming)/AMP-acid ligase II
MLNRILDIAEQDGRGLPTLRHLSYGGGRIPVPVIERAMTLLPGLDLVNAYGLTETSSTITLLSPEDHREAAASTDPAVRARLGSVGKALPTVEIEIRDENGDPLPPGRAGEVWVRGDQVSGEYLSHSATDSSGWYPTRDHGHLDEGGFLFLHGRADDVIVRGGENIAPAEVEERLLAHPAVAEAAVVGVPDTEWGERIEAFVVPSVGASLDESELQEWVRSGLRSTRVPEAIHRRAELPYNDTGKLLRRQLKAERVTELTGKAER